MSKSSAQAGNNGAALRSGEDKGKPRVERMSRAIRRVLDGAQHSWDQTRRLRTNRLQYAAMFAGRHVNPDIASVRTMRINPFYPAIQGIVVNTAYADAVTDIAPWHDKNLMGIARIMEAYADHGLRKINFTKTCRGVLLDGLFMFGCFKAGRAYQGGGLEWADRSMDDGQAYIRRKSPADMIVDVTARAIEEIQIIGDRYSAALPDVQDMVDDAADCLPRTSERYGWTREDVNSLLNRDSIGYDQPVEMVDLIDLWVAPGVLSREAIVLTVSGDMETVSPGGKENRFSSRQPIAMREYEGPPIGGYSLLTVSDVPDSVLGTPLAGFLADISEIRSSMMNHAIESIMKEKKVLLYPKGEEQDAKVVGEAQNTGMAGVANPDLWRAQHYNGVSDEFFSGFALVDQEFSKLSSSDTLNARPVSSGGRNVTATEVQDIQSRLGAKIDAITNAYYEACDKAVADYLHYALIDNPNLNEMVNLTVGTPQTGKFQIPVRITASDFAGRSELDWNFRVRRGSMRRVSTEQKAQFVERFGMSIIPMAMQLAQTGIDFYEFCRICSGGILTPAELDAILPGGVMSENAMLAQSDSKGESKGRKPGMPGTNAIQGAALTGAASPSFDISSNTASQISG